MAAHARKLLYVRSLGELIFRVTGWQSGTTQSTGDKSLYHSLRGSQPDLEFARSLRRDGRFCRYDGRWHESAPDSLSSSISERAKSLHLDNIVAIKETAQKLDRDSLTVGYLR